MKRFAAIVVPLLLFLAAFVAGKGRTTVPQWPDSLRNVFLYTEGIKQYAISGDSVRARELFREAIDNDSTYAPAYFGLASSGLASSADEAVTLARRAYELDSTNKWYLNLYGQTLLVAEQYPEALGVFRRLVAAEPQNPDYYRILSALYDQVGQPYSAISTLDSAELRVGRIPYLSAQKRRLFILTRQYDKAIDEAQRMVETAPYELQNHVVLAELYALSGKDSLVRMKYADAQKIDSTALPVLLSMADFYSDRRDYRAMLSVLGQLFSNAELSLDFKIARFEQLTADMRFYREYYFQLDRLASTLAILYPRDKKVVELYANHLIASGELERALVHYKLHTADTPPQADYYRTIVDIEGYLQRNDSVALYVDRALKLFPGNADFHIAKGNALSYSKDYKGAIKVYRQSLRYARTDSLKAVVWGMIGDTYHQMAQADQPSLEEQLPASTGSIGSTKAARKAMKACYDAYERSLKLYADNALVLNNYAYFLSLEGRDLERALRMSERVAELTNNNPTYIDTRAWVLFRMGRTEEAKQIMKQAVALDGQKSPELMVHYGDILNALGERFMAEIYWRKALEKGYDAKAIERRFEPENKEEEQR